MKEIDETSTVKIKKKSIELLKPFRTVNTEFGEAKLTLQTLLEHIIEDWHKRKLDSID